MAFDIKDFLVFEMNHLGWSVLGEPLTHDQIFWIQMPALTLVAPSFL
jgi:hypothetical protein